MIPRALDCWERLISRYEADVYMHIWEQNDGSTPAVIDRFRPTSVLVEKPRVFADVGRYTERLQHSNPYNVFSMWTSIRESMMLIARRGESYDRVIRARFDVMFDDLELMDCHGVVIPGKPAEIYSYQDQRYPGWHDMMAYGDQESMMAYSETLHAIPEIYSEGSPFFSEFFLSTHLFRNKINTTHHGIFADIVRA